MFEPFDQVADLIHAIQREAGAPGRFPVRFILVSGLATWRELTKSLRNEVAEVLELSSLCADASSFPYSGEVLSRLKNSSADRILLLPLAEIFRLIGDRDRLLQQLALLEQVGTKRIYVPLFEIADLFCGQLKRVGRFLHGEAAETWQIGGQGEVNLTIAPLAPCKWTRKIVSSVREYLQVWEKGGEEELLFSYPDLDSFKVSPQVGTFTIEVHSSAFQMLQHYIPGFNKLHEEWGTPERWEWTAQLIGENEALDTFLARELNAMCFDADHLFSTWKSLDVNRRWLVLLWVKLECRPGSFLSHIADKVNDPDDLEEVVSNAVFEFDLNAAMLKERAVLLKGIGCTGFPRSFWDNYKATEKPQEKLKSLCDLSSREKEEIVRVVGDLLKSSLDMAAWLPLLDISYPDLKSYLTEPSGWDQASEEYFRLYRLSRVIDAPLPQFLEMGKIVKRDKSIWDFNTRGKLIEKAKQKAEEENRQLQIVWFDGLGAEWSGLLSVILRRKGYAVKCELSRASLPSTTQFNKDWGYEGVDRTLDTIAHDYDYQFPRSFVSQMTYITGVADKVANLLKSWPEVLIVSDHGLTRFAGGQGKVQAPEGATSHKWGRYASFPSEMTITSGDTDAWIVEDNKIILTTHQIFQGGTQAGGEVHGGATWEECLTPVILVSYPKKMYEEPVKFTLLDSSVRCNIAGEGELVGRASRPVEHLSLFVAGRVFLGYSENGINWVFRVKGLQPGRYTGELWLENIVLTSVDFQVVKGIIEKDLGL